MPKLTRPYPNRKQFDKMRTQILNLLLQGYAEREIGGLRGLEQPIIHIKGWEDCFKCKLSQLDEYGSYCYQRILNIDTYDKLLKLNKHHTSS